LTTAVGSPQPAAVVFSSKAQGSRGVAFRAMASGGAAFFDLDRTLLRGASGPIITETLMAAGIVADRKVPGMGLFYKFYDIVGETLPGMFLARRAADFASGWVRDAVKEAAETAADVLVESVAPFAAPLM